MSFLRNRLKLALALALSLSFGSSVGCDSSPAPKNGLSFPVDQDGPYGVGYRELAATYTPPGETVPRTIPVHVWYPVEKAWIDAHPDAATPTYTLGAPAIAVIDAPPAAPAYAKGYPVLVHSHGHFGLGTQSAFIFEALAQDGWIAIAPDHVGNTLADTAAPQRLATTYERPLDVTHALDVIENLPASDPLHGLSDTTRVLVSGHSRGTNTVWALLGARFARADAEAQCTAGNFTAGGGCPAEQLAAFDLDYRDPRLVAGIPMAGDGAPGAFGGTAAMDLVTSPVFMMSGSENDVGDMALWTNVTHTPLLWIVLAGGCHEAFAFSTTCPDLDPSVGEPVIRTYFRAFGRRHVLDDANADVIAILAGTKPVSAIVDFKTR